MLHELSVVIDFWFGAHLDWVIGASWFFALVAALGIALQILIPDDED